MTKTEQEIRAEAARNPRGMVSVQSWFRTRYRIARKMVADGQAEVVDSFSDSYSTSRRFKTGNSKTYHGRTLIIRITVPVRFHNRNSQS